MIKFTVPLDWNLSKNRANKISTRGGKIRSYKNPLHKKLQDDIELLVKLEKNKIGWSPKKKKLWILISLFKKGNTGDVANLVDPLMDGIKKGLQLDDTWYAPLTDWTIVDQEEQRVEIYISYMLNELLEILISNNEVI